MKFGGTSVGSAERLQSTAQLIHDERPKIVVLSAMAGTTNSLVEIAVALYANEADKSDRLINELEIRYIEVIKTLFYSDAVKIKGQELIANHFEYIRSFTRDLFTIHEEKAVLAQGELISTALMHYYLEEQNISSTLISALDFMRLTPEEEPDNDFIEQQLQAILKKNPTQNLFITQGFICRNAFGEIDNLKRGGSDY
ncbi:MAG: aspartate kinase, partial [Ignavibacteria bacterium]|nr:aspartate kinase [Ignavibacteria bacterium]